MRKRLLQAADQELKRINQDPPPFPPGVYERHPEQLEYEISLLWGAIRFTLARRPHTV
jgi:hypothetical protein